ncbi:MAG: type IV pilin-like G/H family protein [Cyanobacteriota bacterium]
MLEAGQILQERYQLKQQLGNNAGRQTWLALDIATQAREQVIVKLLPFSPQIHWEDLKLFEREAQVLKHLNHAYIPKYRDYFSTEPSNSGELPWFGLVQDYIPGISLQKQLKNGKRFTEAETKEIATQLLNILIYLHELSPAVLHRDIKPSNIIWGENNQVYLVDFGAVQEKAKAEGATFTVVGTGGYAPPEQLWGRAVPASDLYALGATLIHLLTGIAPVNLPQRQMRLQFRDQVSLSASFTHWLETLIDPAPELRFSNAREALEALQANGSPSPLEAAYTDTQETTPQNGLRVFDIHLRVFDITVLQYLFAFLFVIAMPSMFGKIGKAKQAQVKNNLGTMNRAQQAYFLEKQEFTDSMADLGINIKPQTENYDYSIRATPLAVFNYATPRKEGLRGYVGAVFLAFLAVDNGQTEELLTVAIACETKSPSKQRPAAPIVRGNNLECNPNTRDLASPRSVYKTERSNLGNDSVKLAYSSFNYANAGQHDKALGVAQTIDNADLKARAFATIAITLAEKGQHDKALEVVGTIKDGSSKQMVLDAIARYRKSP